MKKRLNLDILFVRKNIIQQNTHFKIRYQTLVRAKKIRALKYQKKLFIFFTRIHILFIT